MAKFGKWVGLGLGWALGGPIGGILGLAVGSIFDTGTNAGKGQAGITRAKTLRGDYAASLLVLIAAVMKADGRVMKSELDYVRRYFVSRFGEDTASEAVVMLRDILKQEIPVKDVTQQLSQRLDYSYRLEMLHFLYGIASADGSVSDSENSVIQRISGHLSISDSDFQSIRAMFVSQTDASYKILEIEPTVADATCLLLSSMDSTTIPFRACAINLNKPPFPEIDRTSFNLIVFIAFQKVMQI
jgi:DnaJ like chaperone protein